MELTFTVSGRILFHTHKARIKEEYIEARICDVISYDVSKNEIWQVLQFYMHCISVKYHSFRLQTFEGETFRSFDLI